MNARFTSNSHPFLKKIVDSYFLSDKNKHLLFDTDVLWFHQPADIFTASQTSFMMSASHTKCLVNFTDETSLSDHLAILNAGVIFYHRNNFNLPKLDDYFNIFDFARNNIWFIEQAGHAYCLDHLEPLPEKQYSLKYQVDQDTVCRHYTRPRRPLFYTEGIPIIKKQLSL